VESYAKGKRAVIIVDEAQNLELDSLEKLRVISNLNADNHRILQIILSGQPEFREMLNRPELRQLAQRITVDFHIGPLPQEEVGNYIHHRMRVAGCDREVFTNGAIEKIAAYTNGIPRLINILCNNALVFAYADKLDTIDQDTLNSVISVTKDIGMLPFSRAK
ncbi:MAG: AAA family ATPase, partial [Arenicellales bacterium]